VVGSAVRHLARGSGWSSGSLVALGWVEGEFAEEFAGGGVDDADVEILDQNGDAGSGVGSADADGVELAAVAQGDLAGLVDAVVSGEIGGGMEEAAADYVAGMSKPVVAFIAGRSAPEKRFGHPESAGEVSRHTGTLNAASPT